MFKSSRVFRSGVRSSSRVWRVAPVRRLDYEPLEDRCLLSASPGDVFSAGGSAAAAHSEDWLTEVTGSIVHNGTTYPLRIEPRSENQGALIDPTRATWLVMHGRLGAARDPIYQELAAAVDGHTSEDQVLLLDWETAATGLWGGESRIAPVGRWAAAALDDYGFDASLLNLVGYSWGTYVADELAEEMMVRQARPVGAAILLDPAADIWGNEYNPNDTAVVDFAAHAASSWAFHSSILEGSAVSPRTAHESFVVEDSDHYLIRNQFINLLNTNHAGQLRNELFSLERLRGHTAPAVPWATDVIDASGNLIQGATGGYEAIVMMDSSDMPESVTYEPLAGPAGQLETAPFWSTASSEAVDDRFEVDMADWAGVIHRDAAAGVLVNDRGVDLTASLLTGPQRGELQFQSDGAFSYTPWEPPTLLGFEDSFVYQITDSLGQTESATVELVGKPNLHNAAHPTDVNASGATTPLDVLLLINALNTYGAQTVPELAEQEGLIVHYYDVDANDEFTASDILAAINQLNANAGSGGEAEGLVACGRIALETGYSEDEKE